MPPPKTKSGTRKLSEVARHLVVPAGIASSGWPQVEKRCTDMGIGFDEWQRGTGRLLLAKTKDGKYAATVGGVGLSLPRQVGKTYLIGAIVFALCVDNPGLTVIWTAHHSRTAGETFLAMQGMARRKKIAPYVRKVYTAANSEEVRFVNGSRIMFGARERGFGRGFAGVDILVCDEGQILTDRALDNMLATMNTATNALPLFMGTPPAPHDPSESFERMRADALSGESTDVAWIECGAAPGADPGDKKTWASANPSYPHRTPDTSMLRLKKKLKADSWLREGLGIWVQRADRNALLPAWPDRQADSPPRLLPAIGTAPVDSVGLAVSLSGDRGSLAYLDLVFDVAVINHLERRDGTAWMVAAAKDVQSATGCVIALDEKCPDGTLLPALIKAGVNVSVMKLNDYVEACSDLTNRAEDRRLVHFGSTDLADAVDLVAWRPVGDGRKVFGRKRSAGDVDALEATAAALWGATRPNLSPMAAFF